MADTEKYLKQLELSHILREPVLKIVIAALQLPPGSRGLDAGCGSGFYTLMLAEAAGVRGHVTGLDLEEVFLAKGRSLAAEKGMDDRVSFIQGDIGKLPFGEKTFDWVFSMDLVGYLQSDPVLLLKELARTVRPGGFVYIINWSSQMLLPGHPLLEARLNATSSGLAPFDAIKKPEAHSMRALEWFHQAGLKEGKAQTFVGDIQHPFSTEMRKALLDLFEMRWGVNNRDLSEKDQLAYERLCSPDSPDLILNLPGYYGYFTYSLFRGRVV